MGKPAGILVDKGRRGGKEERKSVRKGKGICHSDWDLFMTNTIVKFITVITTRTHKMSIRCLLNPNKVQHIFLSSRPTFLTCCLPEELGLNS